MKKVRIIAALCMIAMLFVACSPAPEKDEPVELVIPEWADGSFTGKVYNVIDATLDIDAENNTFAVAVTGIISIDSSAEGVEFKKCTVNDDSWHVVLTGIELAKGDVDITVVPGAEEGHLAMTVLVPLVEDADPNKVEIDFVLVAAEPVPEN